MDKCASGGDARNPAMLRRAVLEAARREGVRPGPLAGYVAHRLAGESICSCREAAQDIEGKMPEWRGAVASAIQSHADLARLADPDFGLLSDVMGVRQ